MDFEKKLQDWRPPQLPKDLVCGDMPGDKVNIVEGHIRKANALFPVLMEKIGQVAVQHKREKIVVSICGGSGVGKTGVASVLAYYLKDMGIGSYTMSGDNYPRRIPMINDAERLHIFRESAIRGMARDDVLTKERYLQIRQFQLNEDDANPKHLGEYDWYKWYLKYGRKGLEDYLATPNEIDFEEVSQILSDFHNGKNEIWFKRLGRDATELWYEKKDMSEVRVLILEWTHGNSDCLKGVDIPVLLNSTPQETLENRKKRNRDSGADSPFTAMVLEIEQNLLTKQAEKALFIMANDGTLLSYEQYRTIMEATI